MVPCSHYHIGYITRVIIETDSGETIEINGAEVSVTVESEELPHYTMVGDQVRVNRQIVPNQTKVEVKTRDSNVIEPLERLIRRD